MNAIKLYKKSNHSTEMSTQASLAFFSGDMVCYRFRIWVQEGFRPRKYKGACGWLIPHLPQLDWEHWSFPAPRESPITCSSPCTELWSSLSWKGPSKGPTLPNLSCVWTQPLCRPDVPPSAASCHVEGLGQGTNTSLSQINAGQRCSSWHYLWSWDIRQKMWAQICLNPSIMKPWDLKILL